MHCSSLVKKHLMRSISAPLRWRSLPAMRPMMAEVVMTSPACMFSVAIIHRFLLPPATSAISADLRAQSRGPDWVLRIGTEVVVLRVWKPSSPAWVVPHLHDLLFEGQILFARFVIQPLKVNHSVSLFMASADAMGPNLSFVAQRERSKMEKPVTRWINGSNKPRYDHIVWIQVGSGLFEDHCNVCGEGRGHNAYCC